MTRKNRPIKHWLWGQLKEDAKYQFMIFPVDDDPNTIEILQWVEGWNDDGGWGEYTEFVERKLYSSKNTKDAEEELEKLRTDYFYSICAEVLNKRRKRKQKQG